jgi:hypothetical protein
MVGKYFHTVVYIWKYYSVVCNSAVILIHAETIWNTRKLLNIGDQVARKITKRYEASASGTYATSH